MSTTPKPFSGALRHLALLPVLALAGVLDVYRLSQNGFANIFYSAGVRSMLDSWHNFVFVSFDPGGLITIDKPPLGLWVQALSAKLFGFSALSLLLPEAIAGVLAVAVLYWAVVRPYGPLAALAAALTLAVFPSFVAVSRDNNVDALLILLMVLAGALALRAIDTGRWPSLIGCAVLVGLAFNTKTLAAYLIVPAIALAYVTCAPGTLARRAGRLLVAGLVMALISFSWIAFVELTPASKRPFVGGSTDNTELGLTFAYNGFGRVGGQVGGPGRVPVAPATPHVAATHHAPAPAPLSPLLPNGRDRHPIAFGGAPGPFRLEGIGLGDQGGWMLPFAGVGLIALAFGLLRSRRPPDPETPQDLQTPQDPQTPQRTSQEPPADLSLENEPGQSTLWRRDPRLAGLLVLGGWFATETIVLSTSKGIVHPYYVSALGPGVAAMVGAGVAAFVELARRRSPAVLLLAVAVVATVIAQATLLHRASYMHWFVPLLVAGAALGVIASVAVRRIAPVAMALTLAVLLIAPGVYSATTSEAPVEGTFPAAGPRAAAGQGGVGVAPASLATNQALLRYVSTHRPGSRWALLTEASDTASPLILLGLDAGAAGGYSGNDPALDGAGLARLVAKGQARYIVLGGAYADRGGNRATMAVLRGCPKVPASIWLGPGRSSGILVLHDCRGHEQQLRGS
jgi:4-amino-4-deoxy-L-arabinose transferase-like glycosyltransferase